MPAVWWQPIAAALALMVLVRAAPAIAEEDAGFPVLVAVLANRLEIAVLYAGPVPARSGSQRRLQSRSLPRHGPCGECHTPRNFLGATRSGQRLAGTPDGPNGQLVPNITPDPNTGIGKWEKDDVVELLRKGRTPEQSNVKDAMREVVEDGPRKQWEDWDRDMLPLPTSAVVPMSNLSAM